MRLQDAHKCPLPFDIETWVEHLNAKDPLALVIRSHLYVEASLIWQIETVVVNKKQFDSADLPFPTKIKLAIAIGKFDHADAGALKVLNRLRIKFAHHLDTALQEQDELDLYNSLSKRQRRFVDELRMPEFDYMTRLRCDLSGLIVAMYVDTAQTD